jgi:ATP-dependent helicase/DNAse subunit B
MTLALVVGPAHAGKVALLLERYLAALDRADRAAGGDDPWLVVPNRVDVERVERDLLRRRAALLAGRIGTFDDLFEHIVGDDPQRRPVASETQRALAIRNAIAGTSLGALSGSSPSDGFADSLLTTLGEVESALIEPSRLDGDLGRLAEAYRGELDRLGFWDRDLLRSRAVERLASDFDAWSGEPVFAYGFEDLTGAEWALLEALSARAEVTVSIPYEPGRAAFASLERTVGDLAGLAAGSIEELAPSPARADGVPAALVHLERELFADISTTAPSLDGAIGFLEGAGARGTTELVAAEVLELLRHGASAERIGVVCDSVDRWRAVLDTVFVPLGVPFAIEQPAQLGETVFGRALLGLLRFAWLEGRRGDLFRFLRSPFSGLERRSVDFVEGRLRGRAIAEPERVAEETEKLRGAPLPALDRLREA